MLVAAMPIDPTDGDRCWAFHVFNDEQGPFERIVVESVHYVWGDFENHETLDATFGPLAVGASIVVHRETNTELRTGLTLRVTVEGKERHVYAEVGRLYAPGHTSLEDVPLLGGRGKVAELG